MAPTLAELIATEQTSQECFVSKINPRPLGNLNPIAYGGCVIAIAVNAVFSTVTPSFRIYAVSGTFLAPAQTNRKLHCTVTRTRDTRGFATRRVLVSQVLDNGSERNCAECSVDFQIEEPALLTYALTPPASFHFGPDDTAHVTPTEELMRRAVLDGRVDQTTAAAHRKMFDMMEEYFDWRQCLDGVSAQNLIGLLPHARTTQDQLPIYDKHSSEWLRLKEPVSTQAECAAVFAFLLDGGLSFLPLHFNHMDFHDAAACSTLEFSLRITVSSFEPHHWYFRERKTIAAAASRTYSEGKLWNQKAELAAIMTQTSILRPIPKAASTSHSKL